MSADTTYNTLLVDNFELKYTVKGTGIPVIVIGSAVYYPRTFPEHLYKELQFIFVDHRGFSKALSDYTEESFSLFHIADDIEKIRKKLGLNKVMIIGHSGHGYMALEYANKYPQHVSHIMLIAVSPISDSALFEAANRYFDESVCPQRKALLAENLQTLEQSIEANPNNAFITRMLKFAPMIWYQPDYDASWLWEDVHYIPRAIDYLWGEVFATINTHQLIASLKVPVFLGLGRYDYWNPPHLWEPFRQDFKNLTLRVFEKSGHTPQFEEAELFHHELLEWLK